MICFFDIEVSKKSKKIVDMAAINSKQEYIHANDIRKFKKFIKKSIFTCGHNVINHDIPILKKHKVYFNKAKCIDTLFLSVLLFPEYSYHSLVKDDKLQPEDSNNPLNDSKNAQVLLAKEKYKFEELDNDIKTIYYSLLNDFDGFTGFFDYLDYHNETSTLNKKIKAVYKGSICSNADIQFYVENNPIELAYSLALISTSDIKSKFPPWLLNTFPMVETIMMNLRNTPCEEGCEYCSEKLNSSFGLKEFFDYDDFRKFDDEPLQEKAVNYAIQNKSFIVVFPTGGGKSLTYQLPAFMTGRNSRALTVVISPLQSLMKDQVDGLERKTINYAGTINGLLDPIDRKKVIDRVKDGEISLLYISPESLRSKSIEKLLLSRDVARFVIDEAHCFSTWGHDFRVDYLYVGKFIKMIQERKGNNKQIPVSCFTATAKQDVVKDIKIYFKETLNLEMEKIISRSGRENLSYKVINIENDDERYKTTRELINQHNCPTIVYASRTKTIDNLCKRLINDGYYASKFHGQMEKEDKIKEQNDFMSGKTSIMVATSAFGMGVDKSDVEMVIHYEISSSIENYIQEAGRAGRDLKLHADCYILYREEDLDKHFRLLSSTKLNHKEIQQIWRGIKKITKTRNVVTKSALEIARSAGWDDTVRGLQTRVTTAIAALEDSGYLDRKQNMPKVFANSILVENQNEAVKLIEQSKRINGKDSDLAKRITKSLLSSKHSKRGINDEAESRVDYISDNLGIDIKKVMQILRLLREERIIADVKDLRCTIRKNAKVNTSIRVLNNMFKLEKFLLSQLNEEKSQYNLKELNEIAQEKGIKSNPANIRLIINYFDITNQINILKRSRSSITIGFKNGFNRLKEQSDRRNYVASLVCVYLFKKSFKKIFEVEEQDLDNEVKFSVIELKDNCNKKLGMLDSEISTEEIEESLYYLKKINALSIDGGFLVIYSPMNIERIQDTSKRYIKADYRKLEDFYKNKSQQIHIVGEYAKKMLDNYNDAMVFVNDYFTYDYKDFIKKYFNNRKDEINRTMSKPKFKDIFESLSLEQIAVVKDKESDSIVVAAGPGSGKTKLLVHKLAAIFYNENIRHEQLLMLTFSRSAVNEFRERIVKKIGSQAHYFEIKTFHSFCFDLLGRVGDLTKSETVIRDAIQFIKAGEVEASRITKMVIVIDEAQDMKEEEYELIKLLVEYNDNVKLIAVGDDDQNIYSFRGSSNEYLVDLEGKSKSYPLTTNYRARPNLVQFSNKFVSSIKNRMKIIPIHSNKKNMGRIEVTKHIDTNLITPVVNDVIMSSLKGRTCVLTRDNQEANYVAGLLNEKGQKAQLVQENSKLTLYSLSEVRDFIIDVTNDGNNNVISQEKWDISFENFYGINKDSINFSVCENALKVFDRNSGKHKFYSDLKEFMQESLYDDYIVTDNIVVSTLHKSKGKEYDNVFILYNKENILKEDEKRLLYVGFTRAKSNLHIHYKGDFLEYDNIEHYNNIYDNKEYEEPEYLVFTLTHQDVNLGYFRYTQKSVDRIKLGSKIILDSEFKASYNGRKILQLSKKYQSEYCRIIESGYELYDMIVRYKVLWYDVENDNELKVIIPQFIYKRTEDVDDEIIIELKNEEPEEEINPFYKSRKTTQEFIVKNINKEVLVSISDHKTLEDGEYEVSGVSDFFGGTHEGKYYYTVYVESEGKRINIGCGSIKGVRLL